MTRGKGEGSVYKRASDNMWCTSIELPVGLDGKRRRKVVCRRDKSAVIAELGRLKADAPALTLEVAVSMILDAIQGQRVKHWRGTTVKR